MNALRDDALESAVNVLLGNEANDLLCYLAALEDEQRGDTADAEAAGGCRIRVHVHLEDLEFAGIVGGYLIDHRSERATGAQAEKENGS